MYPLKKGKFASQTHVDIPEGTFEEEYGGSGFSGKSAHLYRAHPPTGWTRFEGKLRPHCFDLNKLEPRDQSHPCGAPLAFLVNDDIRVMVSRRSDPMPYYMRNADGNQLVFVHRGEGVIETDFGPMPFEKGDYNVLPRSVTYRAVPKTTDNFFLVIQSKGEFDEPDWGLLKQQAPYDPTAIVTPEPAPMRDGQPPGGGHEWEVRIKHNEEYSKIFYPFNPLDVVGWQGDLAVWKINLRDIRPAMGHRAHATFVTPGAIVSSELPSAGETPLFHRDTAHDEFVFYHDGDFSGKENIRPGTATVHPCGIHYGPHRMQRTATNEYAVMLDGLNPVHVLPAAEPGECKDYWASWTAK